MWLVVTGIAMVIASAVYFLLKSKGKRYKLGFLALMLLGAFVMVLIDHTITFFETGAFIETTTDGLIKNSTILGFVMVASILVVWLIAVFVPKRIKPIRKHL